MGSRAAAPAAAAILALSGAMASAQPALFPDREFDAGVGRVTDLAWSADGRLLAVASDRGAVALWDAPAARSIRRDALSSRAVSRVVLGPQGTLLAAGDTDGRVFVVDLRTGQLVEPIRHRKAVTALAFSTDGSLGASGDEGGEIALWDAGTKTLLGALGEKGEAVLFLGFTGPSTLISVNRSLDVVSWDARSRRATRRGTLQSDAGGQTIVVPEAASLEGGGTVLAIGAQSRTVPRGGHLARGPARPGDLKRVNVILPYAVDTGLSRNVVDSGDYLAERLALAPRGCFAVFSSFQRKEPRLHVWDLGRAADVARLDLDARVAAVTLDAAGRQLAVGLESGIVRTYRVSGAAATDCEAIERRATAAPSAGPQVVLGSETTPLIPKGAGYRVAVLRFDAGGVEAHLAEAMAEMITAELSNKRDIQVVERSEIDAIVREMEIQRSGLTAADAARIGRGLNAKKVFFGSVRRFGEGTYVILARMVDVETQRVEGARQVTCEGCAEKDLPRAIAALAGTIIQ